MILLIFLDPYGPVYCRTLYYYQTLELEKQMEDWMDEYEIETHPELLDD